VTAVFDWLTADPYRAGTLAALLVIAALPAILLLATAPGTPRRPDWPIDWPLDDWDDQ